MSRVAIGLGSNLGDRRATLRAATARIAALAPIAARSSLWETAAVGGPPQGDFLNAAVAITWLSSPLELLAALLGIEADLGRVRAARNGPRTIDLDILWIEGAVLALPPRLIVPHPRLHERAFALAPLLEVVPSAADPRTGAVFVCPEDQGVRRLDERL